MQDLLGYHGTREDFDKHDLSLTGKSSFSSHELGGPVAWFADNPSTASGYVMAGGRPQTGANVRPTKLSMKNPLVVDDKGMKFDQARYDEYVARAKRGGHDGIVINNTIDSPDGRGLGNPHSVYGIFNSEQARSAIASPVDLLASAKRSTPEALGDAGKKKRAQRK